MPKEIVKIINNEAVTDSLILADGSGNEHKSVIQLIRNYQADLEEFGQVAFEMRLNTQGSPTEYAILNEHQATLLLTYMKNTTQIRKFKKNLVKAFFKMAKKLREIFETTTPATDLIPIDRQYRAVIRMAKATGLDKNQSALKANLYIQKHFGLAPLTLLDIELKSPSQKRLLTPSDAGAAISNGTKISGRKVNEILAAIGLQEAQRDAKNRIYWKPTAKGKAFAVLIDTNKLHTDGTTVQQVKWTEDIVTLVSKAVEEVAS